ncbi:MAG: TraR/DksA C4-type zinc finger protein [Gammaproteobacteria bacterium]|nr:TraR/DksA C4-type zinc finger protein [Gammaproteobacteria bacterium]
MKDSDCVRFKQQLIELRDELLRTEQAGSEGAKTVELDQSRVGRLSRMDALQVQAMSLDAERRRRLTIQRAEAALTRIENGEFGLCVRCEQEINPKRLELDPTTPFCIDCANKEEKYIP